MTASQPQAPSRKRPLVLSALALVASIAYIGYSLAAAPERMSPKAAADAMAPDVSVIEVQPETYSATVSAFGAATAHYELALTAKVSGYVASLSPSFEAGNVVDQGEVLLQLDDRDYRSALRSAENNLATAKLALLEEQRQSAQAKAEWESAGLDGSPDSELVLRQPYVEAAQASVRSATAQVTSARADLQHTTISAPFEAMVVTRGVAPGSYVQANTEIGTLYSTDRVEINLALSAEDWRKLPALEQLTQGDWPAELRDIEGNGQWQGRVIRVERHLDTTTRQRTLIVAVDAPLAQPSALLPGTFVDVTLPGRELSGLWRLPNSALSQRSEIWYVAPDNTLASFSATPLFSDSDAIYIAVPEALAMQAQRVLLHPLNNYLAGMAVNPVIKNTSSSAPPAQEPSAPQQTSQINTPAEVSDHG